ncbi:interferon regulatory factor 7 isoform X2 [Emydura macquarii macquarii]|uniref:interferon regulatory factor 7 isoform X2 n=1 Tax=Emydura macquarii macquarii TaxID=1129001 RepID=UPI003529F2D9
MMAASENDGGSQKLRFAHWLINQINSENYEGLCWVDKDRAEFRIPWKHTSRKDITTNDYKIFKAWAIASGKYNEELKDLAKWKTNFRCALRSTNMFLMVQDNSKASGYPHKVYKIISPNLTTMAAANAPAVTNNNLHDIKEDISPQTEDSPMMHHHTPQQLQEIELDLQILSLENPPQKMDSTQSERPAYDLGRNQPNGYTTNNSAPNGYQGSPDTLQWVMEQCYLTQDGCSQQQVPWALDGGLDHGSGEGSYGDRGGYPNRHVGQNDYPQQGSGMTNGPVECYPETIEQWVTQTMAEIQPMQNAYDPSAALHLQQPLLPSTVPVISQLLNNAAEVLFEGRYPYNNHTGVQSTFPIEAPAGNAVNYPTLNGPGENCCFLSANQWVGPAMVEQKGFTHPAVPLPEQHPSHNPGPSQNNTETIPPNVDVTIYYRGRSLHQVQVTTSSCLFTYNSEDTTVAPGCTQVVHFPRPDELSDQKQIQFTTQLLQNIGLLLEQKHRKIYAKRLNKCQVFWALSKQLVNMTQNPEPKLLHRDTETEIFDYEAFSKELKDFREHQKARSPDFTIYLCFGQRFSKAKPKEDMLILVKVTLTEHITPWSRGADGGSAGAIDMAPFKRGSEAVQLNAS